ncbi:MAG: DUF362 domain-containing protein [Candidatus Eremiobacteraeota bacterium]|nr:DUF362 domain-containing protein [Candidatus Eremiobacteraeota bacterium]
MEEKKGFSYMEWGLLRQLKMRLFRSFAPDRDINLILILLVVGIGGILLYFSGYLNPGYLPLAGTYSEVNTIFGFSVTSVAMILFLNLLLFSSGYVPRFRFFAVMIWSGIIGFLFIGLGIKAGFFYLGGNFYSNILFLGIYSMLVGGAGWSMAFILKRAMRKYLPGPGVPQVHTFILVVQLILMFLLLGPHANQPSMEILLLIYFPILFIFILVPSRKMSPAMFISILLSGMATGFIFMQSSGILDRLFTIRFPAAIGNRLFSPVWFIISAWPIMLMAIHVLALLTEHIGANLFGRRKTISTVVDGIRLEFRDYRMPGDFWDKQFMDDPRPGKGLVLLMGILLVLFPLLLFVRFHPGTLALYLFIVLFMAVKIAPRLSRNKLWAALCCGGVLLYLLGVGGQAAHLFSFAEKNLGFLLPLGALLGIVTYGVGHILSLPFIRYFPLTRGRVSTMSPGIMWIILGGLLILAYIGRQFHLAFIINTPLIICLFFGAIFYLLFFSGYLKTAGITWLFISAIGGLAVLGLLALWGFRGGLWWPDINLLIWLPALAGAFITIPWTVHLGMQLFEGEPLGKLLFRESPHVRLPSPKEPAPVFFNPAPGICSPRIDRSGSCIFRMDSFAPSRAEYYFGKQEAGGSLYESLVAGLYSIFEGKEPKIEGKSLIDWWKGLAYLSGKKVFIKAPEAAAWYPHDRLSPDLMYHVIKLIIDGGGQSVTVGINTLPGLSTRFNYPVGFADYWRILGDMNGQLEIRFLDESPYQEVHLLDDGPGRQREGFRTYSLPVDVLTCDYYVNIGVCAYHPVLGVAPAIANHLSMLPSGERGLFSGKPVERAIDYLKARLPDLVILEGDRRYLPGEGESRHIIMSFDAVTSDYLAAIRLGYDPDKMTLFNLAENDGTGHLPGNQLPESEVVIPVVPLAERMLELLDQRHPAPYSRPTGNLPFHLVADVDDPAARNMLAEFLPYIASLPIKGKIPQGTVLVFGKLLRPLVCSRAVLFGQSACESVPFISAGSMFYIPPKRFGKAGPYDGPDRFFSLVSALLGDETRTSLLERIARGRRERW